MREADYKPGEHGPSSTIAFTRGGLWRWAVRVLSVRPLDFEEERKRILFGFLAAVSCAMLIGFGTMHWLTGANAYALACYTVASVLVTGVFVLRRISEGAPFYCGIAWVFFFMFVYLGTVAHENLGMALWVLGYPAAAFFIAGVRFGAFTSALLLAFWCGVFFLPNSLVPTPTYSAGFASRFIGSYVAIALTCMFMEQVRLKYFNAMVDYQGQLESDRARLTASETRLTTMAMRDHLTGVANRRLILQHLADDLQAAQDSGAPLSIAMLDIDHFKRINDNYGHQVGDRVLIECAKRISSTIRDQDRIGRYGGEEFLLIMPDTSLEGALRLVNRAHKAISDGAITADDHRINVTASIGTAATDDGSKSATELIRVADEGLYQAKSNGRNQIYNHLVAV